MTSFNLDNMYCAHIKRGDLLVCETVEQGEFLVLALQDDVLNESLSHVVCVPVEAMEKGQRVHVNEVKLPKEVTGLDKHGLIKTHHISSIDRRVVVSKKGELEKGLLLDVYGALDVTLGRFRD